MASITIPASDRVSATKTGAYTVQMTHPIFGIVVYVTPAVAAMLTSPQYGPRSASGGGGAASSWRPGPTATTTTVTVQATNAASASTGEMTLQVSDTVLGLTLYTTAAMARLLTNPRAMVHFTPPPIDVAPSAWLVTSPLNLASITPATLKIGGPRTVTLQGTAFVEPVLVRFWDASTFMGEWPGHVIDSTKVTVDINTAGWPEGTGGVDVVADGQFSNQLQFPVVP